MTVEGGDAGVTEEPTGAQKIGTTPQKRALKKTSVQEILDKEGTPCEKMGMTEKSMNAGKRRALKFLTNPELLRDREYSNVESWQEYFHSLSSDSAFMDLKDYYNLGYIDNGDILLAIQLFLMKKSLEMLEYLLYFKNRKSIRHDLSITRQKILAWGLHKKIITKDHVDGIDFGGSESAESILGKYSNGIEFDLFIAITEELKPQEEGGAQNG